MSVYLHLYLDLKKKQNPYDKMPSLAEIKNHYVNYLLSITDNNIAETAEILGVSPASLQKRIKK